MCGNIWHVVRNMKNNGKPFIIYGKTDAPPARILLGCMEIKPVFVIDDDGHGDVYFDESLGSGGKLDDNGSLLVHTDSMDNLFAEKPVTYVKMDIEGGEWDALHGMTKTIGRCRPKLAICIYHSSEDMLRIPKYMMQVCVDYNFYVRQHGEGICETVCYAVPKELLQ